MPDEECDGGTSEYLAGRDLGGENDKNKPSESEQINDDFIYLRDDSLASHVLAVSSSFFSFTLDTSEKIDSLSIIDQRVTIQ